MLPFWHSGYGYGKQNSGGLTMKNFKKADPTKISKEELLQLVREGRVYIEEEMYNKLYEKNDNENQTK